MTSGLARLVGDQGYGILDGGFATEIERRGCDLNHPMWSAKMLVEAPEKVTEVHQAFLQAGADIIISSSYQATVEGYMVHMNLDEAKAKELILKSSECAEEARSIFWKEYTQTSPSSRSQSRFAPLVAASIGSYGAFLADGSEYCDYKEDVTEKFLMDFHRTKCQILCQNKDDQVRILAFETVPSLREVRAILALIQERWFVESRKEAWLTVSCKDSKRLNSGESFSEFVALCEGSNQLTGYGVNCSDPLIVSDLLRQCRPVNKLLVVYPNSGEGWDAERKVWIEEQKVSSSEWSKLAREWYGLGARVIGGCCRCTAEDVTEIRKSVEEAHGNPKSQS